MSKSILIYYPSNKSSNVLETISQGFLNNGYQVFLLTQTSIGQLHENMEKQGVSVNEYVVNSNNSFLFYLKHFFYLIRFCKKYNISAIQSHLQKANIISVFAQYFIAAKVVICRHHVFETNKMAIRFDNTINKFAKKIVVPSKTMETQMIQYEKINRKKIVIIPYTYDFSKYPKPTESSVNLMRNKYPCKMMVLICGRFVSLKRNEIAFQALKQLIDDGFDIKLLALDEGPELIKIKQYVSDNKLNEHAIFLGYQNNIMDYIASCDVLLHPSYTEASNNTVKEAGILSKNVIVCEGVGDFSDYIIHRKNGFLVNKEKPLSDIIENLKFIYNNINNHQIGNTLSHDLYSKFHLSKHVIEAHLNLLVTQK